MFKKVLFPLGLAAILLVSAVMSFSGASVQAGATVRITDQANGLLGLGAGDYSHVEDQKLVLDFSNGAAGLQPGADYTFDQVFNILNNNDQAIEIRWQDSGKALKAFGKVDTLAYINDRKPVHAALEKGLVLQPGEQASISFHFEVGKQTPVNSELPLALEASVPTN